MKLMKSITQIALLLFALPTAVMAGESGVLYTQISTNGLGVGYAKSVTNDVAVRGQINGFNHSYSGNVGDFGNAPVDVQLKLATVMALGDWYPTDGGLRITGGLAINQNKIDLNAASATINGKPGVAATAEIKLGDSVSPYLGIGYATRPKDAKGFGFNFDLGVLFQNPTVHLTLSGGGVTQTDADAQLLKVKNAVDAFKHTPVVGLGVNYAF